MTEPDQQSQRNRRVTKEIVAVILLDLGPWVTITRIQPLLADLRPAPPPAAIRALTNLAANGNLPEGIGLPPGPAQAIEQEMAAAWLALYLVAAAERLAEAADEGDEALQKAIRDEERYFALHKVAEERRMRAAAGVDTEARLNEDRGQEDDLAGLLSWRAVLDRRTTPECRAANGWNFKADRMPAIGWPGAVHVHCRCTSGPAIPGAPLLPSI